MFRELLTGNSIVPLLLRIALAAIFIVHGAMKIGDSTLWGAAWADRVWEDSARLPDGLAAKIEDMSGESETAKQDVKSKLEFLYKEEAGFLPATLGFPVVQLAVAWGELIGGICLLLGAATRVWAVAMVLVQLGAIWTVTMANGFSSTRGGYEYNLALIAMCLSMVILGGGLLSVDHYALARWRKRRAVRGGIESGLADFHQPVQPVPIS